MFRGRSQILWYVLGASLLILSGFVALSGIALPYALPIMLVIAGVIIIAAGLLHVLPTFPAFVVFLVGIVAFGLTASAPYGFTPFTTTETHELTTAQATVKEATVMCSVFTGSIKVSFTSNETLIYRIVFTKHGSIFYQPTVNFSAPVVDEELTIRASSTTVTVDITLNQNIKSRLNLTTTTGTVQVEVPTSASKVEKMTLTTTTGEVWVNMASTAHLQNLVAKTTTGQVEVVIKSSFQTRDTTVQLTTTTGRVKLNMNITNIESDIEASTTTGTVYANVIGFTTLSQSPNFHARTQNYDNSVYKKLDVSASTTTGNVDITAYHA